MCAIVRLPSIAVSNRSSRASIGFDPNAIAFARLTQTAREAIAKSGYPDARVKEWEFDGLGPDDRDYIYLDSARARPVAVVTPQMRIVTMRF